MMAAAGEIREQAGWRFWRAPDADGLAQEELDKLIGAAIAAAAGDQGMPNRRSRHATTYRIRTAGPGGDGLDVFVKIYDSPSGLGAIKRVIRGSRAAHAAHVCAALRDLGFNVPRVILCGEEPATGRAILATARAEGIPLASYMAEPCEDTRKRQTLEGLGREIARLHRAGYIHGDLTPHNVFMAGGDPPRFAFIDHDRTRVAFIAGRRRRQLRNLVQLLRFDLPGLAEADRMRVFDAWAAGLGIRRRDPLMRRAFRMLRLRKARDTGKASCVLSDLPAPGTVGTESPAAAPRAGRAG
jgi:lipopolysaccharide kinase (Kdo/WaaP) family protein